MQIVIDIPEEIHRDILEDGVLYLDYVASLGNAIAHGIVLPKSYEEIKDALVEVSDFIECVKNPNDSTEYEILNRISSLIDGILEYI